MHRRLLTNPMCGLEDERQNRRGSSDLCLVSWAFVRVWQRHSSEWRVRIVLEGQVADDARKNPVDRVFAYGLTRPLVADPAT